MKDNLSNTDIMLACAALVERLASLDYPHNFQRERYDLVEYCYKTSAILQVAKELCGKEKPKEGETK